MSITRYSNRGRQLAGCGRSTSEERDASAPALPQRRCHFPRAIQHPRDVSRQPEDTKAGPCNAESLAAFQHSRLLWERRLREAA